MAIDPTAALAHAVAAHQRGDLPAAAEAYKAMLAADPGHAVAWHNLGTALLALQDPAGAAAAFRQCLQADPGHAGALWQQGRLLVGQDAVPAALAAFERLLAIDPGFAAAYARMAQDWFGQRRFPLAEGAYRQLAQAFPGEAEPVFRLATALQEQDRLAEADAQYAEAARLAHRPGLAMVRALMLPAIPDSVGAVAAARERLTRRLQALAESGWRVNDPWTEVDTVPFHLAYHGQDDRPLLEQLAHVYRAACPDLAMAAAHCRSPRPLARRLKVGFVSRFFGAHVVSAFWLDLVARLPSDRLDVVAVQVADPADPAPPDRGLRIVTLRAPSLAALRHQLASAAFDVLVYTDIGMEPITYFLAHARLAPVQIVMGGHPVTTGLPSVDYFLSTTGYEPADAAEHYTERLLRLPVPPVWIRRPPMPAADAPFAGKPAGERWYVCPQSLFKLQPAMDGALAEILRRDPGGRLVLIEGTDAGQTRRWQARFAAQGDVGDRVLWLPRLSFADYGRLLHAADALLDPFPFNGGHSTYTACALGVPPVTLTGSSLRSRVTTGVLERLGVTETVTGDVAGYVDRALALAHDGDQRRAIGDRLAQAAGALFETDAAVRQMADLLVAAREAAGRGERLSEADLPGILGPA
jgi:predicted O-linked N-acetylglucosamine transferase (SPINDLY family)